MKHYSLVLIVTLSLSLSGCKTESEFDRVKKNYEIPGMGVVDEYSAQTKYKEQFGSYPEDGTPQVTEVLERRERSRAHYGGD
jgi:hypothetical protein